MLGRARRTRRHTRRLQDRMGSGALGSRPRSNSGRIGAGANCKCLAVRRGYGCLVRKALKREGLRVHKEKVTDVLFKRIKVPKYEA